MPHTPTVLLVDDYPDALDVWGLYLRSSGFHVLTAPDGLEALATARREHPDVVVMDLELPGMSGLEVARALQDDPATRDIPLIAATGYSQASEVAEARHCGFAAVLVKPCDPAALVEEIRQRLAARDGRGGAASGQAPAASG